jgi:hypothetical protein
MLDGDVSCSCGGERMMCLFLRERGGCGTVDADADTMVFETSWLEHRSFCNNNRTLSLVFNFNVDHINSLRVDMTFFCQGLHQTQHTSRLATSSMDARLLASGAAPIYRPMSSHCIPNRAVAGTSGGALFNDRGAAPEAHYLLRKLIDWAEIIKGGRVAVELKNTSHHSHYPSTNLDIYLYKFLTITTSFNR